MARKRKPMWTGPKCKQCGSTRTVELQHGLVEVEDGTRYTFGRLRCMNCDTVTVMDYVEIVCNSAGLAEGSAHEEEE